MTSAARAGRAAARTRRRSAGSSDLRASTRARRGAGAAPGRARAPSRPSSHDWRLRLGKPEPCRPRAFGPDREQRKLRVHDRDEEARSAYDAPASASRSSFWSRRKCWIDVVPGLVRADVQHDPTRHPSSVFRAVSGSPSRQPRRGNGSVGNRNAEERTQPLPAVARGDVEDEQVVRTVGEVRRARDASCSDSLGGPARVVDDEERAAVLAACSALDVGLDVAPAAVEPLVEVAHGQDELAARVLPIEDVEVRAERQDVGVRVGVVDVVEQRTAFLRAPVRRRLGSPARVAARSRGSGPPQCRLR